MDLEHLIRIPYGEVHKQFYQYENGGKLHQIEYEYFKVEGKDLIINKAVPCSSKIISEKCEKGFQNWV